VTFQGRIQKSAVTTQLPPPPHQQQQQQPEATAATASAIKKQQNTRFIDWILKGVLFMCCIYTITFLFRQFMKVFPNLHKLVYS
jgi:t-SNARE complex subunit (syntaxin)